MNHQPPARGLSPSRPRRIIRLGAAAAVLIAAAAVAVAAPLAASAAPPYATEAKLDSVAFVESAITSGTKAELSGRWSLPDNPQTPAGFVVDLPDDLRGLPDAFPLLDSDGTAAGNCVTTATQLVCDFDSAYLGTHPRGLSGGFSFWATVTTEVTEQTTVTYDFGDAQATVDVRPDPFICKEDCEFTGRWNFKSGEYQNGTDTIFWDVAVAAGADGMIGGQEVVVTDVIGANQELLAQSATGERYPSVWAANELQTLPSGLVVPGPFSEVPASDYTVSADGTTVTLTAREGYFYNVHYLSKVTDGGAAGIYKNDATIRVGTESTGTATAEVTRHGGSGTGTGTRVGTFTIAKEVLGDTRNLGDLTYRGGYTVTDPQGVVTSGEFAVQAGKPWVSPSFAEGSTIALTESLDGLPSNLDWAAPVFSPQTLVIKGEATVDVALTNTATLRTQPFSALKTLDGPDAATSLVPADTEYVLEYSYPAGPGFEAGSGELALTAGTPVSGPALPVGADVTVRERTPKPIEGITWSKPVISPARFTVGGETVTVSVTNPLAKTVTPPPTPGVPEVMTLAATGMQAATSTLLLAGLLLIGGTRLVMRRRLNRSR